MASENKSKKVVVEKKYPSGQLESSRVYLSSGGFLHNSYTEHGNPLRRSTLISENPDTVLIEDFSVGTGNRMQKYIVVDNEIHGIVERFDQDGNPEDLGYYWYGKILNLKEFNEKIKELGEKISEEMNVNISDLGHIIAGYSAYQPHK